MLINLRINDYLSAIQSIHSANQEIKVIELPGFSLSFWCIANEEFIALMAAMANEPKIPIEEARKRLLEQDCQWRRCQ